jgi:hypothetical protein
VTRFVVDCEHKLVAPTLVPSPALAADLVETATPDALR